MSHLSQHICRAALQTKLLGGNSGPDPETETGVTFRVNNTGDFLKYIDYLNPVCFHYKTTSYGSLVRQNDS